MTRMKLVPFSSVTECPACGNSVIGFSVEYSTDFKIPAGNGRFVSTQTLGDLLCPHLEKHCPHCEWGWLEQPAQDLSEATKPSAWPPKREGRE